MAPTGVTLRVVQPGDRAFLLAVYTSTRLDELDQIAWGPGQREAFLEQQFNAQDTSYRSVYPDDAFSVIELGGTPVGRVTVGRLPDEVRLVDIALLPEYRGHGIGTELIAELQAEAATVGSVITLYVEALNPAHRLYRRLGFHAVGEHGIYELMEWRADTAPATSPAS